MSAAYDGLVSKHLNRRFSRPLARWLSTTPVTPNQVSLASFVVALASMGLYFSGQNILAGLAAQVSSVVDGVDGDLARMKDMTTRFGGFFDAVLDRYADAAIIGGMTYWAMNFEKGFPQWLVLAMGFLATVGALMVSYSRARAEATLGGSFDGPAGFLASRDLRLLLIMMGSALGQVMATLTVLAVLTNVVVCWRIGEARKLSERTGGKKHERPQENLV